VNHYIRVHGYSLLQIGSDWDMDDKGRPVARIVAVLGNDQPPVKRLEVNIGGTVYSGPHEDD
jgi:hypothetical protein